MGSAALRQVESSQTRDCAHVPSQQVDSYPLHHWRSPSPWVFNVGIYACVSVQNVSKLSALILNFLYFVLPFVNEA